jgi:hypothetical protein
MKSQQAPSWNSEEASRLTREAYRYVARVLPSDANLEAIGAADRDILDAEEAGAGRLTSRP